MISELRKTVVIEPEIKNGNEINFLTGVLKLKELMWIFNSLLVDITFVDKDDIVKYYLLLKVNTELLENKLEINYEK